MGKGEDSPCLLSPDMYCIVFPCVVLFPFESIRDKMGKYN